MSLRRACAKDGNHDEIADAFRRLGWDVIDTYQHAQMTPGFPDLVVIREAIIGMCDGLPVRRLAVLGIEVKARGGRLTIDEMTFALAHPEWAPVVVRTVDDAIALTRENGE